MQFANLMLHATALTAAALLGFAYAYFLELQLQNNLKNRSHQHSIKKILFLAGRPLVAAVLIFVILHSTKVRPILVLIMFIFSSVIGVFYRLNKTNERT